MSKEKLARLFDAYRCGYNSFEYDDDKKFNCRDVYDEMMKFINDYAEKNDIKF